MFGSIKVNFEGLSVEVRNTVVFLPVASLPQCGRETTGLCGSRTTNPWVLAVGVWLFHHAGERKTPLGGFESLAEGERTQLLPMRVWVEAPRGAVIGLLRPGGAKVGLGVL